MNCETMMGKPKKTRSRSAVGAALFPIAIAGALFATNASAATLNFPAVPLFVANAASPNIMLMLDNSGSMANVVPETPYNAAVNYIDDPATTATVETCSGAFLVTSLTAQIDIRLVSNGPGFIVGGGGPYQLGRSGSSSTFRCFDPAQTYENVRLNATNISSYLPTSYTGNYLNWYFNPNPIVGSYTATWNAAQPVKPLTGTICPITTGSPCVSSRIQIARLAAVDLVSNLDSRLRVGFSTYNNGAGGTLLDPVAPLSTAGKRTTLVAQINALTPGGATPLAETLSDIGAYFAQGNTTGNLRLHPSTTNTSDSTANVFNNHTFALGPAVTSSQASTPPITLSCQRSFAVLLTDGRPQGDRNISGDMRDYLGDCAAGNCDATINGSANTGVVITPSNRGTLQNGVQVGRTYETGGSDYLDDVAKTLFDIDLRPDFAVESTTSTQFLNNVATYFVGFADPAVQGDPLLNAAAVAGGSGTLRVASDSAALADVFGDIISNILKTSGAFSSVATNSTRLDTGSAIYQAVFNSGDWHGELRARPLSGGTGVPPCASDSVARGGLCLLDSWNASAQLSAQNPDSGRTILTFNPNTSASSAGLAFRWAGLPIAYQNALNASPDSATLAADGYGSQRLDWLRGATIHEAGSALPQLRARSSILGDIIDSDPFYVAAPAFSYSFTGYSKFRFDNRTRKPMVYIGANDGMLHGFDAATGNELIGYVPSKAYAKNPSAAISTTNQPLLAQVTQRNFTHRFVVDGSPTVGDACLGTAVPNNTCWRSVLVGGMRSGGQGLFALNVTDPTAFAESNTNTVLWEFTDADDADLGYTFSQPAIVRMANGRWAAVIGNGYNNTEVDGNVSGVGRNSTVLSAGKAALFIIYLDGPTGANRTWTRGTDYIKLVTSSGSSLIPNGLSSPALVDLNNDGLVDYAYAGDENGNLWRFDLSSTSSTSWAVGNGTNPVFTAFAPDGITPQPITTLPEIGFNRLTTATNDIVVYFGTGRYIDTGDGAATGQITQSFYGIFDTPSATTTANTDRSGSGASAWNMLRQTIDSEVDGSNAACGTTATSICFRKTSANKFGVSGNPAATAARGWFIDFLNPPWSSGNTNNRGERQISAPIVRNGSIIFTTLIPDSNACGFGGTGFLMEMDARDGSRLAAPPFDTNNNGTIDDSDKVGSTVLSGLRSTVGILAQPGIVNINDSIDNAYASGSSGSIAVVRQRFAGRAGRITWREVVK